MLLLSKNHDTNKFTAHEKSIFKKSYQFSNIILPVSDSLVYTENNYYSDKILKFGYTYHFRNIKTPYRVIPNGIIVDDWQYNCNEKE